MATTSPDNIRTPDPGDAYNLVPDLANMAGDVQSALIERGNSYKGTSTQRTSFSAAAADGVLWQDTNSPYRIWRKQGGSGGTWQPLEPFEDTGWVPLVMQPGFTQAGRGARKIGDTVWVSAILTRTAGVYPAGESIVATLPFSAVSPASRYFLTPNGNFGVAFGIRATPTGEIRVTPALASGASSGAVVDISYAI